MKTSGAAGGVNGALAAPPGGADSAWNVCAPLGTGAHLLPSVYLTSVARAVPES